MNDTYRVVSAPDPQTLEFYVNQAIRDGWTPLGGASGVYDNCRNRETYTQAMVKA